MFDPMPVFIPFYYATTGGRVEWPEDVTEELASLRRQISGLQEKERTFLQQKARELGLSAAELDGLRSEKGNRYVEDDRVGSSWRELVTAIEEGVETFDAERAYLCSTKSRLFGAGGDEHGCGWVRGIPRSETYNDLAPGTLAGSAGHRHYCRICGMLLAEDRQIAS